MKKIISILFAFVYLTVSVGITLNFHYCGGKLADVGVFTTSANCCCSDASENNSCCEDDVFFFQLNEEHHVAQGVSLSFEPNVVFVQTQELKSSVQDIVEEAEISTIPEFSQPIKPPLWLLNCTFTFYG